ncbi:MAG: dihydrodipicolinate synthase family protein [Streptosporangiaceae bacterium]
MDRARSQFAGGGLDEARRRAEVVSKQAGEPPLPFPTSGRPPLRTMVGYAGITMMEALGQGACGVQPGCSFVEIYQRIMQLWEEGLTDDAAALHHRLLPYVSAWMVDLELIIQVEKSISKRRGWIRSDFCRAPGRRLGAEESADISRFLDEFADLLA